MPNRKRKPVAPRVLQYTIEEAKERALETLDRWITSDFVFEEAYHLAKAEGAEREYGRLERLADSADLDERLQGIKLLERRGTERRSATLAVKLKTMDKDQQTTPEQPVINVILPNQNE